MIQYEYTVSWYREQLPGTRVLHVYRFRGTGIDQILSTSRCKIYCTILQYRYCQYGTGMAIVGQCNVRMCTLVCTGTRVHVLYSSARYAGHVLQYRSCISIPVLEYLYSSTYTYRYTRSRYWYRYWPRHGQPAPQPSHGKVSCTMSTTALCGVHRVSIAVRQLGRCPTNPIRWNSFTADRKALSYVTFQTRFQFMGWFLISTFLKIVVI